MDERDCWPPWWWWALFLLGYSVFASYANYTMGGPFLPW